MQLNPYERLSSLKEDKPYVFNLANFDNFKEENRAHQTEAYESALSSNIGQIICPCGTGKTRIQACIIISDMIAKFNINKFGKYLIASHRLALNLQLIDPLIILAIKCGIPFDILFVGSGRQSFDNYYRKFKNIGFTPNVCRSLATTDSFKIEEFCKEAEEFHRNVIIVSTYHSIDRLNSIGTINIATCDEAHNTTEKRFNENIDVIKNNIESLYFFTATRKVKGQDGGMNDESFYGSILYDADPTTMLERGEIVQPRIHIIDSDNENDITKITNNTMLVKNVIEAFDKHRDYVKKPSYIENPQDKNSLINFSSILEPKLLISFNSIDEMINIYLSSSLQEYCEKNNIKRFAISSESIFINDKEVSKQDFFKALNSLEDIDRAIICNVDILTEGIDLPTITGVMPMRNMSLIKLFQLLGRSLRLHKNDRDNLYNNTFLPSDKKRYVKPFGWLIIPRHLATIDHWKEMEESLKMVWQEYKSPVEEMIIQERYVNADKDSLSSMLPNTFGSSKEFDLNHHPYDIVANIKGDQLAQAIADDPFKEIERFLNEY